VPWSSESLAGPGPPPRFIRSEGPGRGDEQGAEVIEIVEPVLQIYRDTLTEGFIIWRGLPRSYSWC